MYLSTQQQVHPLEVFALHMKLAIICHIHVCKYILSTKVYDGWLAHSGSDPLRPI